MSSPASVRSYPDLNEFLTQHPALRQALAAGPVTVVSPEEGSTRISAAADIPACLSSPQGQSLGALVKERLQAGDLGALAPATDTPKTTPSLSRRRPH